MTRLLAAFALGAFCAWAFAERRKPEPESWAWRDLERVDSV